MGRGWLGISREDRRDVLVAFLLLFGILTSHSMLETARDALFLASLPASRLPWVYLAIAVLTFGVVGLNTRAVSSCPNRLLLSMTLMAAAVITAGFWFFGDVSSTATLYAFYVWTGLLATIAVAQFWILLADRFNVSQAKRAYTIIGAGGLVGATAGAAAAGALVRLFPPRHLLIAAPIVLALTSIVPMLLSPACDQPQEPKRKAIRKSKRQDSLRQLFDDPYLVRLLWLVLLTTLTVTTVDLLFKSIIAENVPASELGSFFAMFYAALNALALVVQLLFASRLLRYLGVNRALWILPALLLAGAAGFVVTLAIAPVLLLKVFDGSLKHSLNRTGSELLYLPLRPSVRARAKVFIDGVGARGGQAIAAVGVLAAIALGAAPLHLAIAVGVLSLAWLVVVMGLERPYLALFRAQLREGVIDTRVEAPELDLHSLEALLSALNSDDEVVVSNALELLEFSGRIAVIPALILYHPSQQVVLSALHILSDSERTDFVPIARRLMQSVDPEIRAGALRAITAVAPDPEVLRIALEDRSATVSTTALVGMVSAGLVDIGEIQSDLDCIVDGHCTDSRLSLVQAIERTGGVGFGDTLRALAKVDEPELRSEIARSIEAHPDPLFCEVLLPMLGDRRTRSAARRALLAIGAAALEFLDRTLDGDDVELSVRRHIPRTISKFRSQRAADSLLEHLDKEPHGSVSFKILRGLGRLRTDDPSLVLDHAMVELIARTTLERSITHLHHRHLLEQGMREKPERATQGAELLAVVLQEKEVLAIERVFRLLDLIHPGEDLQIIFHGLRSDSKSRASSRELLEYLIEQPMRDAVLGMASDESVEARLAAARPFFRPDSLGYEGLLRTMLTDTSEVVRALAAHHVSEMGIEELRDEVEAMHTPASLIADVVTDALAALSHVPRLSTNAS